MIRALLAAALLIAPAAVAQAADLLVPRDHPTPKDALLVAQPGDRVVVTGGKYRNGRITRAGVTLVGDGTTLLGLWEVTGQGAAIEGCTFVDAYLGVTAANVTVRGCRFLEPKYKIDVEADGTGFVFEDNRTLRAAILVCGSGAVLRGNRMVAGEFVAVGDDILVEDNELLRAAQIGVHEGRNAVVRRNVADNIHVWGVTGARVEDNEVTGGGISVFGDVARVERNSIERARGGLAVEGDGVVVRDNIVTLRRTGFFVRGERAQVTDNVVTGRAHPLAPGDPLMVVVSNGPAAVLRNLVSHTRAAGISVQGDQVDVSENVLRGIACSDSLVITGSLCSVRNNTVDHDGSARHAGSGIVIIGDENVTFGNSVQGALYDGIVVSGARNLLDSDEVRSAGRCGITVAEASAANVVTGCTVAGARWSALLVLGDDTTFDGGTFGGGIRIDVLDLGLRTAFIGTTFATKSEDAGLAPYR